MLKFFRNIRKKLLAEGKTVNYLKYAIGEIFLVVIGILIALQVNNWNEDRKDLQLRKKYSIALINDLMADTLNFSMVIERVMIDSASIARFQKRMQSEAATYDTIAHIFRHEFNPFIDSRLLLNNTTLKSLISTGNLSLYPDAVQKQLSDLENRQTQAINFLTLTAEKYLTNLNQTTQYFPLEKYLFDMHPKFINDIWNSTDKLKLAGNFDMVIDWKLAYNLNKLASTRNLKLLSIQIIESLNELEKIK